MYEYEREYNLISTCRFCEARIEFDGGLEEGFPRWISVRGHSYLCGEATWEDWERGQAVGHEPNDESNATAA